MARNRIIYGSQSVWCNGEVLLRVQTLGSTTTFTNEDIFELGHLDIVDVVDDVPAVAVTLNTNDWGDVKTMAVLAQVASAKIDMDATAINSNANLTVISGTTEVDYLHGVSLADFAVTCGTLPGVTIWAPVQDECALGDYLTDDIDQTLFMDEVYVNSLEFSYTTGANATENYGAETDQKMWLLNDGRFVNYETWDHTGWPQTLDIQSAAGTVVTLSNGQPGFLRKTDAGEAAISIYDVGDDEVTNYAVTIDGGGATADTFDLVSATNVLSKPTGWTPAAGDIVTAVYAADKYGDSTGQYYFRALADLNDTSRVDIGGIRQGQVEVYIVSDNDSSLTNAWRLTAATVTADLTREALLELGHLGPYDRPLTLPIPITVTVDSTAGDLEHWSRFADQYAAFAGGTLDDIDLSDLSASEDLKLVIKIYAQTDEEAGGTGSSRVLATGSPLIGNNWFSDGTMGTYSAAGETEYALKTIVVEHLKITDEAYTLDLGANATQTFGFRSTNDLYVIKGDMGLTYLQSPYRIRRNA